MTQSAFADGLQIPNSCSPACAAVYLPMYRECYTVLQSIAQYQGAGTLAAFDSPPPPLDSLGKGRSVWSARGHPLAAATNGHGWEADFFVR